MKISLLMHYNVYQFSDMKIGNDNLAYLYWVGGSLFWVLGYIYLNDNRIDFVASILSRGASMFIFNGFFLYAFTRDHTDSTQKSMTPKDHIYGSLRHFLLTVYGVGFAQAQFYLPQPVIYTIYFSGPLFIVTVDYFYFKKKITKNQTTGVIVAVIGVMLTSNGVPITAWMMGDHSFKTTFHHYKTDSFIVQSIVAFLLIVLTFLWSVAVILARIFESKNPLEFNFNFGLIMTLFAGILNQFQPNNSFRMDPWMMVKCCIFSGFFQALTQHLFMSALLLTKNSGITTMVGFIGMVFSYFLSVYRYSEPLNFICVTGAILVIIGVFRIVIV